VTFGDDNDGSVSFSPDGSRLASASSVGPVCVSFGAPVTQESRIYREALGVVRFHVRRAVSEDTFLKRIQLDSTLSEEVRAKALKLTVGLWKEEAISRSDKLNTECRDVVKLPGRDELAYREALLKAEEASRLHPDDAHVLNTFGLAQHRLGKYRESLSTLTRSIARGNSQDPRYFAVLAMSQQHLGQIDAARAALVILKRVLKDPILAADSDNQNLVREADDLILDASFPANPFAP
jgi:tetratricopeptide (TPR) repeat protein